MKQKINIFYFIKFCEKIESFSDKLTDLVLGKLANLGAKNYAVTGKLYLLLEF